MDRGIDEESKAWQKDNAQNEDTPISYIGRDQAKEVAKFILQEVDPSKIIIISSPWLRCMQTGLPTAKESKVKMGLDPAFGEGAEFCTHDAPDHAIEESFKVNVDPEYKTLLDGKKPETSMKNVATALEERYGFEDGRAIVIFSHADPCIYMAAALTQKASTEINCCSPCAMWTLVQSKAGEPYSIVRNGRIDHLSLYGETKPWHHNQDCVKMWKELGWPPPEKDEDDGNALKSYLEKYHKLFIPKEE